MRLSECRSAHWPMSVSVSAAAALYTLSTILPVLRDSSFPFEPMLDFGGFEVPMRFCVPVSCDESDPFVVFGMVSPIPL